MASTPAAAGLTPQQWDTKFATEYLRNNPFKRYTGSGEGNIFQIKRDLSKKKGDSLTFALVNKFTGAANDGSTPLVGNEEAGASRSHKLTVSLRRNAFSVKEFDEQISSIALRDALKPQMMEWAMEKDIERVVDEFYSRNGVAYGTATEAQKDTWLVDNADRVLFGDAVGNNASNDHSAALSTITAGMTLGASELSLMKRIATSASPKIKPVRLEGTDKKFFVVFAHPLAFRDLKNDPVITQAQREVGLDKENNRLFTGGDIMWDGMIVHEVDDMTTLTGVGASSINVGGVFLCGTQAMGLGIAKEWTTREKKEDDYGNEKGCGVISIDGLNKMTFGSGSDDTDDQKDHGVVSGFFAAVPDA